jgi:hypothetical protein
VILSEERQASNPACQITPALRPGAHVVSPRAGYTHHGIYVGDGLVVHYRGFERGLRIGPIEAVPVDQFTRGRALRILDVAVPAFAAAEIVQRARSRIGEDRYHVLTNNCEHFCEWCVRAEQRSYQVERLLYWLSTPLRIARSVRNHATQVRSLLTTGVSGFSSGRRFHP